MDMEKRNTLVKALAIAGTILVWIPLLAPVLLSLLLFAARGVFRFDYLMPAELFFLALAGSALLLRAAWQMHSQVKLVAGGLGLAVAVLIGGQWLAVATGLASGETEPAGWSWRLVIASLVIYVLGLILVGAGGLRLLRELFRSQPPSS